MESTIFVDALGPSGSFRARKQEELSDVTGQPVARISLVPGLYVERTLAAMRASEPLPTQERIAALNRAGELFATGRFNELDIAEHEALTSRMTGLPISIVRRATQSIKNAAATAYSNAQLARPQGAVPEWDDLGAGSGAALWSRRGDVFAVLAAGNHPGTHSGWLEALALGYRVAVRPSRRDPLTPLRLILALREAGFSNDHVALLPTDYEVSERIVQFADLAMVYGGDATVEKYLLDSRVLVQGPGRSKVLVGANWSEHLDMIVDSVSLHGGVACTNATAVLVDGDPAPVAAALAQRLAELPSLPPLDEGSQLPVQPTNRATALQEHLAATAAEADVLLGAEGIAHSLGDGSAVLRPAVFQVSSSAAPQLRAEMPFPCVWVAPWTAADGIAPLRDTLVLATTIDEPELIDDLCEDPSVRNVYLGRPTSWRASEVPHDGFLGDFLMRTKGIATVGPQC